MNIKQALAHLDPANDDHWTADGLPRMDALVDMTADPSITRKLVTDADPQLTRDVALERASGDDGDAQSTPSLLEQPLVEPVAVPDGGVLAMPLGQVLADPDLTSAALDEIAAKMQAAIVRRRVVEDELAQLGAKNEMLKRVLIRHERSNPSKGRGTPVQDYLARQREAREEKARRRQAFIDAGMSTKDIIDILRPGSKLDVAMSRRKPALGASRPEPRPLVGT